MRCRTRALLTVPLVVVLALGWLLAAPATGGGPTSVLLSAPGEGRLVAFYFTDAEYDELSGLLALTDLDRPAGSAKPHQSGQVVTLTWLIHDVQVWRVDRVNLVPEGPVWVETRQPVDDGSIWDARPVWHRVDGRIAALLARSLPERGSAAAAAGSLLDQPVTDQPVAAAPAAEDRSGSPLGSVAWGAGGALAGAAVATGLLRRRRRERPEPVDDRPVPEDRLAWP